MDDKKLKIALSVILGITIVIVIIIACVLTSEIDSLAKEAITTTTAATTPPTTSLSDKNTPMTDLIDATPVNIQPMKPITAKENEIINLSEIKFVATYDDKSRIIFDANELTFSSNIYQPMKAGVNKITIMYRDGVYSFDINAGKTVSSDKTKVELAMTKYENEYKNAEHKHYSKNLFFTAKSYMNSNNGTYWIAHVVINDTSQLNVNLAHDKYNGFRESPIENADRNGWLIGINASMFSIETDHMYDHLYINNGKIIVDGTTAGNEMCITKNGTWFTAPKGLSANALINKGVIHTVISNTPTLVENRKPCDISDYTNMNVKTAIGMISETEYYIVVASDGDYISDVAYSEIQDIFINKRCVYAKCMDGGANSFIIFNNNVINNAAVTKPRPVFDYITFSE